ncbi:hypothetical protein [Pontimicrobium sp. IMCC45349]|uniref:hypothetical protein n=1 Tax=Pontimicrobium sp. IMCC45349 TaxID=3391574 RepID=UPI0039A2B394
MKKALFLFLIVTTFWSCSIDDSGNSNYYFEILPIENATVPLEFVYGQTYLIEYSYYRPSTCHFYNDLYYVPNENERTIAVINTVFEEYEGDCTPLEDELINQSFTFVVNQPNGHYLFKFWQGHDENGDDIFLTFEIPVVQ